MSSRGGHIVLLPPLPLQHKFFKEIESRWKLAVLAPSPTPPPARAAQVEVPHAGEQRVVPLPQGREAPVGFVVLVVGRDHLGRARVRQRGGQPAEVAGAREQQRVRLRQAVQRVEGAVVQHEVHRAEHP
eukprot:CAMPEP_0194673446 /NCGR_PEP_ID=MMETSP0295-20121207/7060_1 /TAXON_ID=39354 /ORGANISM="Heterosigma akashiwo, Strain CCMP2393" /LENGTH=128 /DNA_ID=CAMNT_0039557377 /DNA_START=374 /DNA_END=758 /DNA_ORIENTATION=+